MKICQKHKIISKVSSKFCQILYDPPQEGQCFLTLCQSGKILPNLVTLLTRYNHCWTQIALESDGMKGRLYSRTSFIYKYKTFLLTPFVKPCEVLKLAIQNVFYVQSYVDSTFTYNPGLTIFIDCVSIFCQLSAWSFRLELHQWNWKWGTDIKRRRDEANEWKLWIKWLF